MYGEIATWGTPGQRVLYSCLQLFLKLKMFNPLAHKKVEERCVEKQLFTEWGEGANPRQNPSRALHCGSHITCPCSGFGVWSLGASGSLVKGELPGHRDGHSQVTGLKDAMGNAVVFDVLWSEGTCRVQSVSRERAKG